jgi:molybdopterin-containing oxidoreductase family membrane subunit
MVYLLQTDYLGGWILFGNIWLFFTCYFLFSKFFPVIALAEIKHILKRSGDTQKEKMDNLEEQDGRFAGEHSHDHGA